MTRSLFEMEIFALLHSSLKNLNAFRGGATPTFCWPEMIVVRKVTGRVRQRFDQTSTIDLLKIGDDGPHETPPVSTRK